MAASPLAIDENSPFRDEACALCKDPFNLDDQIIVCPDDATRHHVQCWEANGNHCTAYGCEGQGIIVEQTIRQRTSPQNQTPAVIGQPIIRTTDGRSKVRVLPFRNLSCTRSCLWLILSLTMFMIASSCFGFLLLIDYAGILP